MSGRLVGEVAEWLRSPAAAKLTMAERLVLVVIAERVKESDPEHKMLRHGSDDITLFERLCEITGMDRSGLTKALKRLSAHGVEVRMQIGTTKAGGPLFAYRGVAMRFRLPTLPASIELPERVDEEAPIKPVDNSPEGSSGAPSDAEKGWTGRDPFGGKGGREGTQNPGKGAREGIPSPSKDSPSKDSPSSCGPSPYGVAVENAPPAAAPPSGEPKIHMGWEPTYREAVDLLQTLHDLGGRYMAQAEADLPAETRLADRVIYAAQLAKEARAS